MCQQESVSTSTPQWVLPWLLWASLWRAGSTVLGVHLALLNTSPPCARLRTPLLKHHVEMSRENVFELRPRRMAVPGRSSWLTR